MFAKTLRALLRPCRAGLAAAGFLALAACTCGLRAGLAGTLSPDPLWRSCGPAALRELLSVSALYLFALHPFGCALSAALLLRCAFSLGLDAGALLLERGAAGIPPFCALLPASLLSLAAACLSCAVTAHAALRAPVPPRRAYLALLALTALVEGLCALLRCLV